MLKIKICGLRDPDNIQDILKLKPDYIGLIFYPQSRRFVGKKLDPLQVNSWKGVKKTGVFVNADLEQVQQIQADMHLDALQLHGEESPEFCRQLRRPGLELIKAFGVDDSIDWSGLTDYQDVVDYFLLDTRTAGYGGSGRSFSWDLLQDYPLDKPYFLSGGLSPENIAQAAAIEDPRLYGLDLNSGFEERPGFKDVSLLNNTLFEIRK